jgi:hypothetical protein
VTRERISSLMVSERDCSTALSAIGTKHPLAPEELAVGLSRIVAAKKAVPVQRFNLAAAGTALRLQGKSASLSEGSSRTK